MCHSYNANIEHWIPSLRTNWRQYVCIQNACEEKHFCLAKLNKNINLQVSGEHIETNFFFQGWFSM